MDKKTQNLILKKLRDSTRFWHLRNAAAKRAKVKVVVGYFKNGNRKYKTLFKCAHCKGLFDKVDIDHIEEVGPFLGSWDEYIPRLFCELDNLQALCKDCHKEKTAKYNKLRDTGAVYL
jgi:5-methylcytosine-specific restriction endonuclease McrA